MCLIISLRLENGSIRIKNDFCTFKRRLKIDTRVLIFNDNCPI